MSPLNANSQESSSKDCDEPDVLQLRPATLLTSLVVGERDTFGGLLLRTSTNARTDQYPGAAPLRRLTNGEYLNTLHDLFPGQQPVLPTLPNDALVGGFDNAAESQAPSDLRIAGFDTIANLYAQGATSTPESLRLLVGCTAWSTPSLAQSCANQFLVRTGAQQFRRPLSLEEMDRFKLRFDTWSTAIDFEAAVRLTLSTWLQAPQFLYRPEPDSPGAASGSVASVGPYAMASRLSYFLWESTPDELLLAAAAGNALTTETQVRAQAERMLADPRAKRVYWSFYRQWLGLDRVTREEHAVRTADVDVSCSLHSQTSALHEARLFVENIAYQGGTLSDLLSSPRAWLNPEMAHIYGVPDKSTHSEDWREQVLPAAERAGLLTRTAFLAGYGHRGGNSPPVRGNGVQLNLLCALPEFPPPGVDLSIPMASSETGPRTTRALFEQRTNAPSCTGCHQSLNGFGFGLEHYNAAGIFQATEHGLPIDAKSEIVGTDVDRAYNGAVELSRALATRHAVHACASRQWLRYALGRAPTSREAPQLTKLIEQGLSQQGSLNALFASLASSTSFRTHVVAARTEVSQ